MSRALSRFKICDEGIIFGMYGMYQWIPLRNVKFHDFYGIKSLYDTFFNVILFHFLLSIIYVIYYASFNFYRYVFGLEFIWESSHHTYRKFYC